jgi:N-acetylmuramoyl-L-alanine amidase
MVTFRERFRAPVLPFQSVQDGRESLQVTAGTKVLGVLVRWLVIQVQIVILLQAGALEGAKPKRLEIDFSPHGVIRWDQGGTPALMVDVRKGDGWISLAARFGGTSSVARTIRHANPRLRQPMTDRGVRIPLELLRADLREDAVERLFPIDRRVENGLEHWVLDPFGDHAESWRWLAALFAKPGTKADDLKKANTAVGGSEPVRREVVLIPDRYLLAVFSAWPRKVPTPEAAPAEVARSVSQEGHTSSGQNSGGALSFGVDAQGEFALYRLRRGEALYSAVVVRFTGQLHAAQVNATALEIARRSGIKDVTDIPVGFRIKIPLDLVLPEYLSPDHPRRLAWEREQKELAGFLEVVRANDLSGVHVILDAGHGGRDTGAVVGGVWESTYAYDILCRVKENLARHTQATVWTTIKDRSRQYTIPDKDVLRQDRDQFLLTEPAHILKESAPGVHMRWYLANDIILDRIPKSVPRSKVVFISIHADSLHASVRGSMVYVPSRHLRRDSYQAKSRGMDRHQEYKEHPKVSFSSTFSAKAEASSRHLAGAIIESLKRNGIPVHPNKPIRDRVRRGRATFVPAVLRYSLAQNAVLVECTNMANAEDRTNLMNHQWREAFSRALVEGIASAFDGS